MGSLSLPSLLLGVLLPLTVTAQSPAPASSNAVRAEEKVYTYVEKMPTFRGGGTDSIISYLRATLHYPPQAVSQQVEGKSFISFVVSPTGTVEQAKVAKSAHPLLDAEALRVIEMMPAWEPGQQAGQNVPVSFTLPILFRLPPPAAPVSDESFARFPGGPEALRAYLTAAPYPEAARGTEGRVFVQFEIGENGQVRKVSAIQPTNTQRKATNGTAAPVLTADPLLAEAAEARVAAMPAWQPALNRGKPVVSMQTVPVDFYRTPPATAPAAVYVYADQMPVFAGNSAGMPFPVSFFRGIRYPPEALRNHIQGKGLLYFVVNEQGQIEQTEFIQTVHPILDREVLRALSDQKVVTPARLQGQPVKVFYVLPLNFGIR